MKIPHFATRIQTLAACCALAGAVVLSGCQEEKKILDVDAPGVDVEVKKNTKTGEVHIEGEFGDKDKGEERE